jgi:hypothetical protein
MNMIVTIILVALIAFGLWKERTDDYGTDYILLVLFSSAVLFFHLLFVGLASFDHGEFVAKRNAFESTLQNARESGSEMESAAILKEVSEWNQRLASRQFSNSQLLLDPYIDDRIDNLKPIK